LREHGVDNGSHGLSGIVGDGLAFEAAMVIQPRIPVAVVIGVAIRRVRYHGVDHPKRRQHLQAIPEVQGAIANLDPVKPVGTEGFLCHAGEVRITHRNHPQ
jgi:hypothetical protein